jgi:hypothetical protein
MVSQSCQYIDIAVLVSRLAPVKQFVEFARHLPQATSASRLRQDAPHKCSCFSGTLNDPSKIFCQRSPPSVHNGRCAGISSTLPKGSRQAHVETETSLTDDLWEYFSIRAVYMRVELRQCKIRIRFGGPDMEEVQVCVLGAVGGV